MCDNLLEAGKLSYVVNTKDLLFLAIKFIMLLRNVIFSINHIRRDKIKNGLLRHLHFLYVVVGNPGTNLLLGDDVQNQKETHRAKSKPKGKLSVKEKFWGNKHKVLYHLQYQNKQYRNY